MVKYGPKDFEVYVAKVGTFDMSTIGNDSSLALAFDAAVTDGTELTNFIKLNDTNSCQVTPADDTKNVKKYIGSDANGAQNSETFITEEPDVDITISADPSIIEQLTPYSLKDTGATHTGYTNYARFNLGGQSSDKIALLIRVAKTVGSNHYYKNWLLTNPTFVKDDSLDISGDDDVATTEYSLTGTKTYTEKDFYSGTTAEVVVHLDR